MDVKTLAEALLGGDVRSAQPLIDRLQELGDPRVYNLLNCLTDLNEHFTAQWKKATGWSYRTEEEKAYRLEECRYRCWGAFADKVEHLFWYEIHGVPDLAFLKTIGRDVGAERQAARSVKERTERPEKGNPVENSSMGGMGRDNDYDDVPEQKDTVGYGTSARRYVG